MLAGRRRVAVLSPYFPYPLSHGGAVRIFNLLREIAREFDVELFAFTDGPDAPELAPVLEFCARVVLVGKPRYREPRWSTLLPPEVHEFRSPAMRRAIAEERRAFGFEMPAGGIHATGGIWRRHPGGARRHVRSLRPGAAPRAHRGRLVGLFPLAPLRKARGLALSACRGDVEEGRRRCSAPRCATAVIENGVDLARFLPEPEQPGERLLFIGSFRHFPNVEAYRFFTEQVWPLLREKFPQMTLTVVCGADPLTYWRAFADTPEPPADPRIRLLGFVADVRPLYVEANLVIVPTTVSAGTNVKVLEAMAMQRAVVSTTSGCAGLGLLHGHSVWVADTPEAFAAGIATLIGDPERRAQIAQAAYGHARRNFDWPALGEKQREIMRHGPTSR